MGSRQESLFIQHSMLDRKASEPFQAYDRDDSTVYCPSDSMDAALTSVLSA